MNSYSYDNNNNNNNNIIIIITTIIIIIIIITSPGTIMLQHISIGVYVKIMI